MPLLPELSGMDEFRGTIVHSHDYRIPDPFKDKDVVCLGGAASGQDICLDMAQQAKKVSKTLFPPYVYIHIVSIFLTE